MVAASILTLLTTALCASLSAAVPMRQNVSEAAASSNYWLANIAHTQDTVWQNSDASYKVFRNVMTDYGAKGDGVTDDTAAINRAMSDGNRCGGGAGKCDSSTITPALVYFPAGTYIVSKPITMYYMTQMVGDPTNLPTIRAASGFAGMAMLDADPYDGGDNWYTNQNNFYRQVRNFNIDVSPWSGGAEGAGIHWQVAQATSLQNINFKMSTASGTKQQGIFMDNGSGGFFSDLTFTGGLYGAFLGSQQFTSRNLTFTNCKTAIFMNWNWGWVIQGITVTGSNVGIDMSVNPKNQSVGSVILADSTISANYGVRYAYQNDASNVPATGGTLILDHVQMNTPSGAVVDSTNKQILAQGSIANWASGNAYDKTAKASRQQGSISTAPQKAQSLLDGNGNIFARSKPQYETVPASSFLTAKQNGCKGNGQDSDTAAIQALLNKAASSNSPVYFEHGAYLVDNTVTVPPNVKIVGEIWPLILADGSSSNFNNAANPKPVFQIGTPGQSGGFEMSDIIFSTVGPAPGAIMIEWNLNSKAGEAGMWDTHARIGGASGTKLELAQCPATKTTNSGSPQCEGVFLMFQATPKSGGVYLENTWFWVADHELDTGRSQQLSIYSGRGMLIQSQAGPVWLWGTASEHSILYNYQFEGVTALFSGFMQAETPYFQPNPSAPTPLHFNSAYDDPTFTVCNGNAANCKAAWGLRIVNSQNVLIYGAGLYSFYDNYDQTCVPGNNCQQNMIHIQGSQNVGMYAVSTKAAVNMLIDEDVGTIQDVDNRNNFCATLAYYFSK